MQVGEYVLTDSRSKLVTKKNATIVWNTEPPEVSYSDILLCLHVQRITFPYRFRHLEISDT